MFKSARFEDKSILRPQWFIHRLDAKNRRNKLRQYDTTGNSTPTALCTIGPGEETNCVCLQRPSTQHWRFTKGKEPVWSARGCTNTPADVPLPSSCGTLLRNRREPWCLNNRVLMKTIWTSVRPQWTHETYKQDSEWFLIKVISKFCCFSHWLVHYVAMMWLVFEYDDKHN